MKIIATIVLALFITTTAQARLEETYEQCVARYGEARDGDPTTGYYTFYTEPFSVLIHFHEGKADVVVYRKLADPKTAEGGFTQLSDGEMQKILEIYGSTWKQLDTSEPLIAAWKRASGSMAVYDYKFRSFTVATKDGVKNMEKAGAALDSTKGL